jgi:hypothetical protein
MVVFDSKLHEKHTDQPRSSMTCIQHRRVKAVEMLLIV